MIWLFIWYLRWVSRSQIVVVRDLTTVFLQIILALDVTTDLLDDLKKSFEAICQSIQGEDDGDGKRVDKTQSASAVDKDLKFFLHVCEVKKLHDIYGKVNSILEVIQHKQWVLRIHFLEIYSFEWQNFQINLQKHEFSWETELH